MTSNKLYSTIFLVAGIVLLINLLSDQFFIRFDFTADKQYTLSKATKDLLKGLDEPVTVKAYFSENLPPDFSKIRLDFRDLLVEYENLSGDMVVFEFINPNEDEKIEQEAMQNGIQPVLISVREKDQMKQQKAYLGAVISLGEEKEVIPFMQSGSAMEYALSTAIKKISVTDKPSIGLLQGNGEPSPNLLSQAYAALSVLYQVETVELTDEQGVPGTIKTLAIVAPKDSMDATVFSKLEEFLGRGGNLLIAMNRVEGDFSTAMGSVVSTGLEGWLRAKGIEVSPSFLIDVNCGSVTVQQQQGFFTFNSPIQFPYLPIISNYADHPVTKGLEAVMMKFASPINYVGTDTSARFTPIAFSSEKSGVQQAPLYFNIQQRQWNDQDFPLSKVTVGGVLEQVQQSGARSRIVLFSDGDFPISGERGQQTQADNVSLFVNGIDWLSDDTGLIDLRTKGVNYRPIKQMEDDTKTMLKYLNFLAPILLAIGYGVFRAQMRRRKRIERMLDNHED